VCLLSDTGSNRGMLRNCSSSSVLDQKRNMILGDDYAACPIKDRCARAWVNLDHEKRSVLSLRVLRHMSNSWLSFASSSDM
jgi:hypothetical protein